MLSAGSMVSPSDQVAIGIGLMVLSVIAVALSSAFITVHVHRDIVAFIPIVREHTHFDTFYGVIGLAAIAGIAGLVVTVTGVQAKNTARKVLELKWKEEDEARARKTAEKARKLEESGKPNAEPLTAQANVFCRYCGKENPGDSKFCKNCRKQI